jgi:uncharacterized protein
MRSTLLEGRVRHRRQTPTSYELDHGVYYVSLDLDELDEVPRSVRLIRRNRPGVVELRDADHLVVPATDLRADVLAHLRADGIDPAGWRISLVTNLRVAGYVFNPASFYLCRDTAGNLAVVVVEVHNTHGERHCYTLRAEDPGPQLFAAGMAKSFYVSPFIAMDGSYRVAVRDTAQRLSIAITEHDSQGRVLATSLVLRRRPLNDRMLLSMLIRHPFMPQRTIGLIHWHALRLWLRGVPFRRHGRGGQPVPTAFGGRSAAVAPATDRPQEA